MQAAPGEDLLYNFSQNPTSSLTTCNMPINRHKSLWTSQNPSSPGTCSGWIGYCPAKRMLFAIRNMLLRSPDKSQAHPSLIMSDLAKNRHVICICPHKQPVLQAPPAWTGTDPNPVLEPRSLQKIPTIPASLVLGEDTGNHTAPSGNASKAGCDQIPPSLNRERDATRIFQGSCGSEGVSLASAGLTIS